MECWYRALVGLECFAEQNFSSQEQQQQLSVSIGLIASSFWKVLSYFAVEKQLGAT